jgi:cytochrome c-type biogenesis protein CcmH/NrfG
MSVILNTRETVVIYFFWMVFAAMILTAATNMLRLELPQETSAPVRRNAPSAEAKIAEYQQILTQSPKNLQALIGLGDIYFDSQRQLEAIEIFTKALAISPSNTHVLHDLGLLNMNTGDLNKALEHFLAALTVDPTHTHSLYYVGVIYRHNGETIKALEAFEQLLTLNPPPDLAQKARQEITTLRAQHGTPE